MKDRVAVILGPTATGKSHCAIELAKRLNGEIISGDSMYVYKGMDIVKIVIPMQVQKAHRYFIIQLQRKGNIWLNCCRSS